MIVNVGMGAKPVLTLRARFGVKSTDDDLKGHPASSGIPLTSKPTWSNMSACSATSAYLSLVSRTAPAAKDGLAWINPGRTWRVPREIGRITGVRVREAAAEIEPTTGTSVKVFARTALVQAHLLAETVGTDVRSNDKQPAMDLTPCERCVYPQSLAVNGN